MSPADTLTNRPVALDAPSDTRPAPPRPFSYQPALDGLRALAVLAVLLYHAKVSWAPGGFLGVDAFFVLSGFLITTLLFDEWRRHGRIDLRAFWARRARRLLPALLLVLVAVGVYAAFVAGASERSALRGDALGSLFYVANWRQLASTSYFAQFSAPSPLLHTWSLGIEEQWYLVWPLALLGMLWLARRVARRGSRSVPPAVGGGRRLRRRELAPRRVLVVATLVLAAVSALLMAALYHPGHDPSRVYYGTDTRAQSLLIGAALAFALVRRRDRAQRSAVLEGLGVVAVLYVGWLWTHVPDTASSLYRGGFLVEALAVAVIVAAAVDPGSRVLGPALSIAPLRAIGRISYGVYLWHWPVYVFLTPQRTGLDGSGLLVVRIAVTFVVAIVSFFLVEMPLRRHALRRPRERALAAMLAVATAVAILVVLVVPTGSGGSVAALENAKGSVKTARHPASHPGARSQRVLITGDSVAFTLFYWLRPRDTNGVDVQVYATLGCGLTGGTTFSQGADQPTNEQCGTWPLTWRKTVDDYHPNVAVVFAGAWDVLDHRIDGNVLRVGSRDWTRYMDGQLDLVARTLGARGAKVVLLTSPCFGPGTSFASAGSERSDPERVAQLNGVFRSYATAHPTRVSIVDLHAFLCPGNRYTSTVDGKKVRNDDGVHLTEDGSRVVWRWLAGQLNRLHLLRGSG